jgi:hypothetical protein
LTALNRWNALFADDYGAAVQVILVAPKLAY